MSKESESYRLEMLRSFEQKNDKPDPPEVLEAQKVIAKHRAEQAQAREAIPRLRTPLPKPDLCPECYYLHGRSVTLEAASHPNPAKYDRMKCSICGYAEDRAAP